MDIKNSIRRTFTEDEEWQGQVAKTHKKPTIKVNYNVPTGSELRIYQSPVGYTWTYDTFTISGFGSKEVGVNGSHYYVWFKSGDDADATLSTYLMETINDEFAVSVVGMNFDEDGKLLVSGTGGATGGDASAANQILQLNAATNSNLAQWTQLHLIQEATEIGTSYLQGILQKSTALEHSTSKYLLPAATTLAPDTTPGYQQPPEQFQLDAGWYWKNTSAGRASQLYYFSYLGLDLQVPARQATYLIGDITGGWAVVRMLNLKSTAGLPFLVKYSVATGTNDVEPWHKSKWVYTIPTSAKISAGQEYLIYWGLSPDPRFFPETERIALELSSTSGTAQNTEQLAYLTLNTASNAPANHAEYIVRAAGWIYGAQHISELEFSSEPQSLTITAGDATSDNQVASNLAICARLDSANLTITNSNLALASRLTTLSSNIGQLSYSGSNVLVFDKSVVDAVNGSNAMVFNQFTNLSTNLGNGLYMQLDTSPVISGGVRVAGSTDGNVFVHDKQAKDELVELNTKIDSCIDGTSQLYVRLDGTDDSVQIMGWNATSSMPEQIYTVDNAAKVYVDNVVNSLLLAKNSVLNNVNLMVDAEQRLLSNTVIVGTVPVSGEFYQATQPVSIADTVAVSGTFYQATQPVSIADTVAVSIADTVAVSIADTVAVSGTFYQATQPVSIADTVAVSGTFWQTTQPVSISGTVPISSGSPLDTHIYGSSDGSTWHHIKTNPQGIVATNAIMETDANGALTSENVSGTENYNALHSWIKNPSINVNARGYAATESAFVPIAVDEDGKVATTLSGAVSVQNAVGQILAVSGSLRSNLATVDNGHLTSTLSGTGNSIHSLDVAVQNSVSVQNVSSTQLAVKSAQFGSYGNIYNLSTVNPYTPSVAIDVSNWAYYVGYYEDSFVGSHSYPQALRMQYSFDNINWYNIFNTTIYPSSGAGGINTATIYKQDIPGINYLRFYNDTADILPNVKLTVMGASN